MNTGINTEILNPTNCRTQVSNLRSRPGRAIAEAAIQLAETQGRSDENRNKRSLENEFKVPVDIEKNLTLEAKVRTTATLDTGVPIYVEVVTEIKGVRARLYHVVDVRGRNGYYCGELNEPDSAIEHLRVEQEYVDLSDEWVRVLEQVSSGLRNQIGVICRDLNQRAPNAFFGR